SARRLWLRSSTGPRSCGAPHDWAARARRRETPPERRHRCRCGTGLPPVPTGDRPADQCRWPCVSTREMLVSHNHKQVAHHAKDGVVMLFLSRTDGSEVQTATRHESEQVDEVVAVEFQSAVERPGIAGRL